MSHPAVEIITARAWQDLFQAGGASWLQRALGLSAEPCGPALVLRCRAVSSLLLNRTLGLAHAPDGDNEALVDSVLARYRAQHLDRFMLHLPADDEQEPLRVLLRERGLAPYRRRWVHFVRGAAPVTAADGAPRVSVLAPDEALAAARVLAPGFDLPADAEPLLATMVGRPGWHAVGCRVDGVLAGAGVVFVQDAAAYLAMAATVPAYRGRGIQRALMVERIRHALSLGCTTICTETGEAVEGEPNPSYNNMLRCGFEPVHTVENWVPEGTTWLPEDTSAGPSSA